jgi:hypothetical protein
MSWGFIIGNGISRAAIPANMYEHKTTYACNLAYRDFASTHLVCCDRHMVVQAIQDGACSKSQVWTRQRWFSNIDMPLVQPLPDLPYTGNSKYDRDMDWGSGSYAALLACQADHDLLIFVGFDLWGSEKKVNSIYAGENGYSSKLSNAVNPQVWIHQLSILMETYPEKQFVFLNETNWTAPHEWSKYENFNSDNIKQITKL